MKLYSKNIVIASLVMGILPLLFMLPCFGASIQDVYPGGTGLTTNTLMLINLDSPVAMIGNQPDMTYCVKKVSFSISGFDYIINNTNVPCDAAASDDRKSVTLYPQALLDTSAQYSYRIENINFQGGGSAGHFSQCYATGNNPLIPLAKSDMEAKLCTDYNYEYGFNPMFWSAADSSYSQGNSCYKCHVNEYTTLLPWADTVGAYGPIGIPTCTP
jgi:hypothetical protein